MLPCAEHKEQVVIGHEKDTHYFDQGTEHTIQKSNTK